MLILLAACGAASTLWAAEPAPAKPAQPAAQAPAAKPADESAAPKNDEDSKDQAGEEAAKSKATTADKKGSSPQRFVPSEQVRADFDVSFPIDI
jgi:hypothetical protein